MSVNHCPKHRSDIERIKAWVGVNTKMQFTQEECIQMLDSGNTEPLYKAFSAYAIKHINNLTFYSPMLQDFFEDIYQECMLNLSLAIQRYDREKNSNFMGWCMLYVKGGLLSFVREHTSGGVIRYKVGSKLQKDRDEKRGIKYANVCTFSDLGLQNEDEDDEDEYFGNKLLANNEYNNVNEDLYYYVLEQNILSPFQKTVFELYYLPQNEYNSVEIGKMVGKTPAAVTSALSVIKQKLKNII